jgi:hypothetical protein
MPDYERNQMKITVSKTELLAKLQENRAKHEETFEDALVGYYKAVIDALEEKQKLARAHKKIDLYLTFTEPRNHVKDYDRVIGMLTMHTGTEFELTDQEYASYVDDNWSWAGEWHSTAKSFSAGTYAKNYGGNAED